MSCAASCVAMRRLQPRAPVRAEDDLVAPGLEREREGAARGTVANHGDRLVALLPAVAVRAVMRADAVALVEAGNVRAARRVTPPAMSTVRASAARPSASATVNPSGLVSMPVTRTSRSSMPYGAQLLRVRRGADREEAFRRASDIRAARARARCAALRASQSSTRRRQRPRTSAALRPAGPPPTMTTSYIYAAGARARPLDTADFDFDLPDELIAQEPPAVRGASRLLVLHRKTGDVEHAPSHGSPTTCSAAIFSS